MLFVLDLIGAVGETMSSCEICGNSGNTKLCNYAGAKLQMCGNCMNKMGVHAVPGYLQSSASKKKIGASKSVYSRSSQSKSNVMHQSEDIKQNFSKLVANARNKRGWTKEELAAKISEKANVIKRVEQGIRPSDKVIRKIEKCMGIKLMEKHSHVGHSKLSSGLKKGFTMGDFLERKK